MACGNNKVSRDYLSSQPTSATSRSQRLFNDTRRARDEQIVLVNSKGEHKLVEERYSNVRRDGAVEYFLDENRNKTLDPKLHVHVIHDERKNEVHLHITDRRGSERAVHTHKTTLPHPSGNEVNAAETRLAMILRDMKSGKK